MSCNDQNTASVAESMDCGIGTLEIDADVIASKNKLMRRNIDHIDSEIKQEYLLPIVKKETCRSCDACLCDVDKRFRNHYFVREMENFTENIYRKLERCRQQNFAMKSAIRSSKDMMCKTLGVEMNDVDEMFEKQGLSRLKKKRGIGNDTKKLKAEAVRNEMMELAHENKMLKKKSELLCKETEWLNKDIEELTETLAECNMKRLQDKACLETIPGAKEKVLKAKRSHNRFSDELKNLVKTNDVLCLKLKTLSESVEEENKNLSEEDTELDKLRLTKKRLVEKWLKLREVNHNEIGSLKKRFHTMQQDFASTTGLYHKIESVNEAKISIVTKIEQYITCQKLTSYILGTNINDLDLPPQRVDELDNDNPSADKQRVVEKEKRKEMVSSKGRLYLNSLQHRLEKIKGLHEEKNAKNALLATKLLRLNRLLDQRAQSIINLQKIRISIAERKVKLRNETEMLEKTLRGLGWTDTKKAKQSKEIRSRLPEIEKPVDSIQAEAMSEENRFLNLLASRSMLRSVEDLSIYTTLSMMMSEKFRQDVENMNKSFEKSSTSSSSVKVDVTTNKQI